MSSKTKQEKDCLNCGNYITCKYINKRASYHCDSWTKMRVHNIDFMFEDEQGETTDLILPRESKFEYVQDEKKLETAFDAIDDMFDSLLNNDLPVPRDLKIDDRDFPLAKNFWDFCTNPKWGLKDTVPFSRQLWIATKLFGEYCYDCSKKKSGRIMKDVRNIRINASPERFKEKIVLLEHGICPECKKTKLDLYREKKLKNYSGLAHCSGQRCVTGDTLVLTEDGLSYIEDYAINKKVGFNEFHIDVENGLSGFEKTSDFYMSKPERVYRLKTSTGHTISGTGDHPVYCVDKFKKLTEITEADYLKLKFNTQIYGNKVVYLAPISEKIKSGLKDRKTNYIKSSLPKEGILNEGIAKLLGFWVAEGIGNSICNTDQNVLDFCEEQLTKLFTNRYVDIVYKPNAGYAMFRGLRAQLFFQELVGTSNLNSGSANKFVPSTILQGTKECQSAFLQGLYEGNGGFENYHTKQGILSYYTISKQLANEVSAMLLNMGIVNRIFYFNTRASNGTAEQVSKKCYRIEIVGKYLEVFQKEIGFFSDKKRNKLLRSIKEFKRRQVKMSFYYDKLPERLKTEFTEFVTEVSLETKQFNAPKELQEPCNRNVKVKSSLGLWTIFGYSGKKGHNRIDLLGRDIPRILDDFRRMQANNVSFTFDKGQRFCEAFTRVLPFLSKKSLHKLNYFKEIFYEKNVLYTKVVENRLSKNLYTTYDFTLPKTHQFWTNGLLSHNSGKSLETALFSGYIIHRYLKLQKPSQLMTGTPNAQLQFVFVGVDKHSITQNIWLPLNELMNESKWFIGYHEMLKDYNAQYDDSIFKNMDTFIAYRHRNMFVHPAVPNQRALRGATRALFGLDEIGWFDAYNTDKVTTSADGVYQALNRSLFTVRNAAHSLLKSGYYNIPSGYEINISSPSAIDDKIMQLITKNSHSKTLLTVHTATWEINPKVPKDDPYIAEAYLDNPIAAERDYGANPPINAAPFIEDEEIVKDAFTEVKNKVEYEYIDKASGREDGKIYRWASVKLNPPQVLNGSVMALDAGRTFNSFIVTIGHRDKKTVVFNTIIELAPEKGRNEIDFSKAFHEIIEPLIRAFNVKYVVADRWQSLFLLDELREKFAGLQTEIYSVKYDDFVLFKSYLEGRSIKFPALETKDKKLYREGISPISGETYPHMFKYMPLAHLYNQCLTVQDAKKTVQKASNKTDDIFRAVVLATSFLLDDDIVKKFLTEKRTNPNRGIIASGASASFSGTSMSNANGKGLISKL